MMIYKGHWAHEGLKKAGICFSKHCCKGGWVHANTPINRAIYIMYAWISYIHVGWIQFVNAVLCPCGLSVFNTPWRENWRCYLLVFSLSAAIWTQTVSPELCQLSRFALKGKFFQPWPYIPMFLCLSDEWGQRFLKLVQGLRESDAASRTKTKLQCNPSGQLHGQSKSTERVCF